MQQPGHFCRTCLQEITDWDFIALKEDPKSVQIKLELSVCVPEMIIERVVNPVLCMSCIGYLHMAYSFKSQCLRTEDRICTYLQGKKLHTKNTSLVQMQEFTNSNRVSQNQTLQQSPRETVADDLNNLLDDVLQTTSNAANGFEIDSDIVIEDKTVLIQVKVESISDDETNVETINTNQEPITTNLEALNTNLEPINTRLSDDDDQVTSIFDDSQNDSDNEITESNVHETCEASLKRLITQQCAVKLRRLPDTYVYFIPNPFNLIVKPWRVVDHSKNKPKNDDKARKKSLRCLKCAECGYSTVFKWALTKHLQSHGICHICTFRTNPDGDGLKVHMAAHAGGQLKFFNCTVCDFCAKYNYELVKHMRSHTGEKPFFCKICNFRTAYRSSITSHKRKYHSQKSSSSESTPVTASST